MDLSTQYFASSDPFGKIYILSSKHNTALLTKDVQDLSCIPNSSGMVVLNLGCTLESFNMDAWDPT